MKIVGDVVYKQPLAHKESNKSEEVNYQLLEEHLLSVGNIAGNIGNQVGIERLMTLIGYLHDLGKADSLFQDYLNGIINKRVNHSSAGAKYLLYILQTDDRFDKINAEVEIQYYKEILIYVIQSHHGLYDVVDVNTYKNKSIERLNYSENDDYSFEGEVIEFANSFNTNLTLNNKMCIIDLIEEGYYEFKKTFEKLKQLANQNPSRKVLEKQKIKMIYSTEVSYYLSCFTRLCLSILKEADIYDSANAFLNEKQKIWNKDELNFLWCEGYNNIEKIYLNYQTTPNSSELNRTRTEMSNQAKLFAEQYREGIFKLELPTGAGKTKTSLRYALTNSKNFKKNRILYVTAYLSVLEQNAKDIKEIINNSSAILEHHSNVLIDDEGKEETKLDYKDYQDISYLRDSWESPYVLTTMVQFFNTLFKGQASNIRRFCKLIDAVIIIDEVQSLPLKTIYNFNLMMNFMKTIMHCNIVHCTATQPYFDTKALEFPIYYGDSINNNTDIVSKELSKRSCFNRVNYYNLTGINATARISTIELVKHISTTLNSVNSCLIVLNTKASVLKLYNALMDELENTKIIYLTTNLCAAHRLNIIEEIKNILVNNHYTKKKQRIVCISTQLIEAGVDLDFDCVYRSMSGIDSLVQCAGRCNREGKLLVNGQYDKGKVFIINYDQENLTYLPDIKQTKDASEEAIRRLQIEGARFAIPLEETKRYYFEKYYIQNKSSLSYWYYKENNSMLDKLSRNTTRRTEYKQVHQTQYPYKTAQSFKTAAEQFQLIENNTVGMLVYYQNHDLMEQLEEAIEYKDLKKISILLKKLQRTTVNVYHDKKLEQYAHYVLDGEILVLGQHYYDEKLGIVTDGLVDFII